MRDVVLPAAVTAEPWSNGKGTTRELWSTAHWRISLAEIIGAPAFSTFPGTDRLFVALTDPGVTLHLGGRAHHVAARTPVTFGGDDVVTADTHGQRIEALNVMVDQAHTTVSYDIQRGAVTAGIRPDVAVILGGSTRLGRHALPPGTLVSAQVLRRLSVAADGVILRLSFVVA
ncbi:HutD family protein [Microbacterium pullorum]|uniref:HutD family protein n=1 Tax=Microbacterium pullorum TaxID=2762236 RepID=UPI001CD8610E|nr:HutD family protein [Microbacterium pullorum]